MQIDVTNKPDGVLYTITRGEAVVMVECGDDHTLKVKGPKELMASSIGGRGDENEKEAWFQDKDFSTASEAVSNVLEILKNMNKI